MDLHQLRVFYAAGKSGGFTRASEQLHLSQSTVSQHIKQLEEELDCPLFLRVGKRVLITEAGNVLLQYAEKIFHDLKNAEMAVREMNAMKRGAVRLGVGATTLTYRLTHVLGDYNRRFPDIELIVLTGTTEFLLDAVKSQNLDLAIVMSTPVPPQGMTVTPLGREELVVVMNREHPLARKSILEPGDLSSIDGYFESLGVTPRIAMEVESIEAIKSLIRAGLAASILPLCATGEQPRSGQLRVMRVRGRPLARELGLAALDAVILPNAIRELATALMAALGGGADKRSQKAKGKRQKSKVPARN